MYIKDMMTRRAVSVAPDEPITAAARLLKRDNIGSVPVCDSKGQLQGIITDRDIVLRCVAAGVDPDKTLIRDVMTTGVFTVSPTDTVESAAALMGKAQVRRLPVCENGTLVGMLSLGDLACSGACNMEASAALTEISSGVQHRTGK
ncbi:MAG: CBS domain-containing protein [Oscillospiraceae bacterium]|jgi:CBS domain-containing protein|nr:CBS domain-containing protein [Oscillospiraceae bacterium]